MSCMSWNFSGSSFRLNTPATFSTDRDNISSHYTTQFGQILGEFSFAQDMYDILSLKTGFNPSHSMLFSLPAEASQSGSCVNVLCQINTRIVFDNSQFTHKPNYAAAADPLSS